ncbi:MAG TPA: hypothetical protein VFR02_00570 [bacterium]|nr:hypothetical protein [bacterium]
MSPSFSLALGTAAFGGQVTLPYAASVLAVEEACAQRGIPFQYILQSGDALVQRARQQVAAQFLGTPGATHLLMVDSDIVFSPEQAFRLLESGKDLAAAVYPRKIVGEPSYEYEPWEPSRIEGGFRRAKWVGAGFLLLKREALLKMEEAHPELRYSAGFIAGDPLAQNPHRSALFNSMVDPKTGEYLADDRAFCRRWTDLGGEIWVDTQSRLRHIGPRTWEGDLGR